MVHPPGDIIPDTGIFAIRCLLGKKGFGAAALPAAAPNPSSPFRRLLRK